MLIVLSAPDLPWNHLLIGPPASGKTTFARALQQELGAAVIISTDGIRERLYGDAAVQGPWAEIEAELQRQIQEAVLAQKAIIYDATNVKRAWRMGFLQKLQVHGLSWIGWELKTDLKTCKAWNQQRSRQVPEAVIENFHAYQRQLKPMQGEGFVGIASIDPVKNPNLSNTIQEQLKKCRRSAVNHENRYGKIERHRYSRLRDFDRLLHLIALLSCYPGIGSLQEQQPELLQQLLKTQEQPNFQDSIAEIAAILGAQHGEIYCDSEAIAADLDWLESEGFLGSDVSFHELTQPSFIDSGEPLFFHHYSDWDTFKRLFKTIRYIIQNPLTQEEHHLQDKLLNPQRRRIDILANQLIGARILVSSTEQGMLRKDIEWVLHPYRIFPEATMRRGYYLGTGILNRDDLLQIYQLVDKQVLSLDNPIETRAVNRLRQGLEWARFDLKNLYPVRSIAGGNIVNSDLLSNQSLATADESQKLEQAIRSGQAIRVGRFKGAGQYQEQPDSEKIIWPLQIVFHNIAWYLGYELAEGDQKGLYCYERLDRLYQSGPVGKPRSHAEQKRSLDSLELLRSQSYGLYLGGAVAPQQALLQIKTLAARLKLMQVLELRFSERLFRFVSEGTQRFPDGQVKMTLPPDRHLLTALPGLKKIYSLPKAADPTHPYQMKVWLPAWSIQEVTLKNWIMGMGGEVKVLGPTELCDRIIENHRAAAALYADASTSKG